TEWRRSALCGGHTHTHSLCGGHTHTLSVEDYYNRGVILYKNKEQFSHVYEKSRDDGIQHVSSSATLQLAKGDRVYLSLSRNFQLYDDKNKRNTFNGFLVSST